jgi:hypothetical protein
MIFGSGIRTFLTHFDPFDDFVECPDTLRPLQSQRLIDFSDR